MTTTSLSDAKVHLSDYVKAAEDTHERTTITKNGKPAAVLLSYDDFDSLLATVELLSDPDAWRMSRSRSAAASTVCTTRPSSTSASCPRRSGTWRWPTSTEPWRKTLRVGAPSRAPFEGQHKEERGSYSVTYRIVEQHDVVEEVVRVAHRSDVYRP